MFYFIVAEKQRKEVLILIKFLNESIIDIIGILEFKVLLIVILCAYFELFELEQAASAASL
jgi:hypothetical protein